MNNYHLDDIIFKYQQNCEAIYKEKENYIEIYQQGLKAKVISDYKANNIVDEEQYFNDIERMYSNLERFLNQTLERDLTIETKKFSQALSSFFAIECTNNKSFSFDASFIQTLKEVLEEQKDLYQVQTTTQDLAQDQVSDVQNTANVSSTQIIIEDTIEEEPIEITTSSMEIELSPTQETKTLEKDNSEADISKIYQDINHKTNTQDTLDQQFSEIQSLINDIKGML